MVSCELIAALTDAFRKTPRGIWKELAAQLTTNDGFPDEASVQAVTSTQLNRDAAWILSEAFREQASTSWREIAAAMVTVDSLLGDKGSLTEIVWSGPTNNRFPVRRLDQVLYDLIAQARRRIVLVTFAAHRVEHLCRLLTQAVERGVELTLIVETKAGSEGQLSSDAATAFENVPLVNTHIYCWPPEKRERNQRGRPGKLHVKCAIVDDIAMIGSANLTDDGFNRNMELGIVIRDRETSFSIFEHFRELICSNLLVEVKRSLD